MKRASKGWIPDLESSPLFFLTPYGWTLKEQPVILPNSGTTISQPRIANAKRFGAVCIGEEKSYFWSKKASIATRGTFSIHS